MPVATAAPNTQEKMSTSALPSGRAPFFIWRTAKYITTGTMDTRAKYISQSFAVLAAAPPAA